MRKKENLQPNKRSEFSPILCRALKSSGLNTDGLIFCCTGDMDNEACYTNAWLSFDEKGLYIAFGNETIGRRNYHFGKSHAEPSYEITSVESFPIDDIKSVETEIYTSTGRLLLNTEDGQISLTRFSIGLLPDFDNFVRAFNSYKGSGTADLPKDDAKDEHKCKKCGAPCPPGKDFCRKHNRTGKTAVRLFKFFGGYIPQVIIIILVMTASSVIQVLIPQISTKTLYDDVLANPDGNPAAEVLKALGVLVLTIFGVRLLNTLLTVFQQYVSATVMPKVMYDIKNKIFMAMQRLSVSFYSSKQTGSLMDRVMRDATNIYWFFTDGLPRIIIDSVMIVGILVMMFRMNVRLSVLSLSAIPILLVMLFVGDKIFRKKHHRVWVHHAKLGSIVSDNINGQRIIKAFSKEDDEYERFSAESKTVMDAEINLDVTEATVFPVLTILVLFLTTFVLGYGAVMIARGESNMTAGTLLSFIVYLGMLQEPFGFFSWISNWWSRCSDSAQRIFEVCDAEPDITEKEDAVELTEIKGNIEITDLEFEYEPARPIIKKLSMHVSAGDMLGIVGKTGAGKSTIANLIARLYDAKAGTIKIDGIDVRDLKMQNLRKNIGIVSQDIYLFYGSIADNIRYAKPDASMDEVIAAAKAACAHDFIMSLPDAYETFVGAGGQKLSGGEKQRVSIARTIIQNPRILILDEATAAMDTETERNIQASLNKLTVGRTTIAIAHRLSTLRDSDYLAVIDDGRIVEYGTFAELIRQKGEFFKQYKIQSEALKTIGIGEDIKAENNSEEADNNE